MMDGLLILPDWLVTTAMDSPRPKWGVRIVGSSVDAVAPNTELVKRYPDDTRWDAPGAVLAPGFVNAHTHTYGVLAHGIPLEQAPSGFWPFLEEFWWPRVEDRLDIPMIQAAMEIQCARMLMSGVTTFYDCLEAPFALPGALAAQAEIVRRHGVRAVLSFEATERISPANGQLGLEENLHFIETCQRDSGSDLHPASLSGMLCIHTTFTCSAPFIQRAFALAQACGVSVHAHVAEGSYEPSYTQQHYGRPTLHTYDHLGVLGPHFLASQCVQIGPDEIALMAEHGARMVHMPLSNCEVGGGIAPVPELLAAGVTVGLGSDGYIDDFYEVLRGAFLIHKATHLDPQVMPAHEVWHLATEGGARALGLEGVGRLQVGWQADAQVIDTSTLPTPLTERNLFDQILLHRSAHHVSSVLVAGRVRVRDGILVDDDLDALLAHSREAAQQLWQARG